MKCLKENWTKVLLLAVIGIFALLYFLKDDFSDEYKELKVKFNTSQQEVVKVREVADKEVAKWKEERDEERAKREKSDKEIEKIQSEKRVISRAFAAEKAKVKEMADDKLVVAMNKRIGEGQVKLLQMGVFSLKRQGAENTVQFFIEGEECQKLRKKDAEELKKNYDKIESLLIADSAWLKEVIVKDAVIEKQDISLKNADNALRQLEKNFKIERWKKRGEGVLGGVLLVLIVKAVIGG